MPPNPPQIVIKVTPPRLEKSPCEHPIPIILTAVSKRKFGGADDDSMLKKNKPAASIDPPEPRTPAAGLLLAETWDSAADPNGYWMSEKLDGVRAHWTGASLLSRQNTELAAPEWFVAPLPREIHLDGVLYAGRGNVADVHSLIQSHDSAGWEGITFQIFDIVDYGAPFEERFSKLERVFASRPGWIALADQERCRSRKHLQERLEAAVAGGGEGLILREPKSLYVEGRSRGLLQVDVFLRGEAVVVGHEKGRGGNSGCMGLRCRLENGKEFVIRELSELIRAKPPAVVCHVVCATDGRG
jgi:DNA ligase 1